MNFPAHVSQPLTEDRSIGAILIDAGRLNAVDAERIIKVQREQNIRFGDAAKSVGLLSEEDIQFALARQFEYPYLSRGKSRVAEEVLAAYSPFSPVVEQVRAVRSQLMLRWFRAASDRKSLAIVSADSGDGRSWLAANLAVVFSQLGERTLLIDADMRKPRQHELFGLANKAGLSAILSGRSGAEAIQRIPELLDLSVLTAGAVPPNPAELIGRPVFTELLNDLGSSYDVILMDTSPVTDSADAQVAAVRAGAALMVVRRNVSKSSRILHAAETITEAGAGIVGSVLNDRP